jgi:hypothetical protein
VKLYLSLKNFVKEFTLLQCPRESVNDPALFFSSGRRSGILAYLASQSVELGFDNIKH